MELFCLFGSKKDNGNIHVIQVNSTNSSFVPFWNSSNSTIKLIKDICEVGTLL